VRRSHWIGYQLGRLKLIDEWFSWKADRFRDRPDLGASGEVAAALGEVVVFDAVDDVRPYLSAAADIGDTEA
jgi:hypothetical protein